VVLGLGTIIGLALAEKGIPHSLESADGRYRASVRSHISVDPPQQTLWLRDMRDGSEIELGRLSGQAERVQSVHWSADSRRVAFLLDGTRLLVFEAASGRKIFDRILAGPEPYPGNRCVRNLSFQADGNGVSFDLCHRWKAGVIERVTLEF